MITVVAPYCDQFAIDRGAVEPAKLTVMAAVPLSNLYNENNASLTLAELVTIAQVVDYNISEFDAKQIEQVTRDQSKCSEWFVHRTSRVTASKLENVCRSNVSKLSVFTVEKYLLSPRNKIH